MKLSSRSHIQEPDTLRINALAAAKRAAGERVFNLSVGEPLVTLHSSVADAADSAMREGRTKYPPVAGIPELRDAATTWLNASYGSSFTPAECLITGGGKFALFSILGALVDPGDEVLVIAPYWVSYPPMVQFFDGVPTIVQTSETSGWKVSVEDLEAKRTDKTKILIFNNASNPTGVLYSREEVEVILVWAQAHDIFVISDEVYSGLVYDDRQYVSCGSFQQYKENVAIVQSASKNFAMTGLRIGFLCAPADVIKACTAIQGQSTSGPSIVSQYAAVAACQNAVEITSFIRMELQRRRDVLITAFTQAGIEINTPASALYAFVSLAALGVIEETSGAFCERMLQERNVALVPGSAFGMEGYVRLSFGGSGEDIQQGVDALIHRA